MCNPKILARTDRFFLILREDVLYQLDFAEPAVSRLGSVGPCGSTASILQRIRDRLEIHDPSGNRYEFLEYP